MPPFLRNIQWRSSVPLDNERLESIMMGLDCIQALFAKIVEGRNKKIQKLHDMEQCSRFDIALGKRKESHGILVEEHPISRVTPSANTGKITDGKPFLKQELPDKGLTGHLTWDYRGGLFCHLHRERVGR